MIFCHVQGDEKAAKISYETAMRQTFNGRLNVAPLMGLGTLAFNQGRYEQALSQCAWASTTFPRVFGPLIARFTSHTGHPDLVPYMCSQQHLSSRADKAVRS